MTRRLRNPAHDEDRRRRRSAARLRRRDRILQATAILPSTATILNGICGFASIHFATKAGFGIGDDGAVANLMIAGALIFAAMFFDMLDGGLARMTKRTSEFGAELDSLSDVISFGVAPAILSVRTVFMIIRDVNILSTAEPAIWCVSAIFVACTALRLARFNVETSPELSAHMSFRGLPSPGAAAAVAALVLLFAKIHWNPMGSKGQPLDDCSTLCRYGWSLGLVAVTLMCGLLMVSRFKYPHVVNRFFRGKRSFNYLVTLMVAIVAGVVFQLYTLAAATVLFAFWGPLEALYRVFRPAKQHTTPIQHQPPTSPQA